MNSGTVAIGTGKYHYQLVLTDVDGHPQADTPFAFSLRNSNHPLPFVTGTKQVWQDVTDSQGKTPVFALPFRLESDDAFLRKRFGSGPYGEQFHVTLEDDDSSPWAAGPYRIVICTNPPQQFFGFTNAKGYTRRPVFKPVSRHYDGESIKGDGRYDREKRVRRRPRRFVSRQLPGFANVAAGGGYGFD